MSTLQISSRPNWAARRRAVFPVLDARSTFASATSTRPRTVCRCPSAAAHISAVWCSLSSWFTLAPSSIRNSHTPQWPLAAAFISAVSPFSEQKSADTPYSGSFTSISQICSWPCSAAHMSTFQPSSSLRSRDAPSSSSSLTMSASPCSAAFIRAVMPSSSFASNTRRFSLAMVCAASLPPLRGTAVFFRCSTCASIRYCVVST
mmetsp:Transcript_62329/g.165841  ORF Transcript_62329/g.165841 Transcript_62329/m.165841 type:complete len:204 (-) Transcript_62329:366-977(-)